MPARDATDLDRVGRSLWGLSPKRAVILALVVCAVALTLAVPLRTYFSQRSEAAHLREANAQVSREVADYRARVAEQSDSAYVEAQARARLGFVRPGEKPLVMAYPQPPAKSDEQKRAERQAGNPWYTNLLDSVSDPDQSGSDQSGAQQNSGAGTR